MGVPVEGELLDDDGPGDQVCPGGNLGQAGAHPHLLQRHQTGQRRDVQLVATGRVHQPADDGKNWFLLWQMGNNFILYKACA